MGYIYVIQNKINIKKYIGQSQQKDINTRWNSHKNLKHKNVGQILLNAYKKYGIENFTYKVICICFDEDTNKYEKEYIKMYNTIYPNGYNLLEGGDNHKHNEYTKKIISEKLKGEKHPCFGIKKTPEELKKMSERMKGNKHPCFGKKFTEEEKQKRIDRYKNNPKTGEQISNSLIEYYKKNKDVNKKSNKRVEQYDLNGNLINEFYSISEAARSVNLNVSFLSRTCNKENYTAGGFIWKKY
jgi:group I intron endonuclease